MGKGFIINVLQEIIILIAGLSIHGLFCDVDTQSPVFGGSFLELPNMKAKVCNMGQLNT